MNHAIMETRVSYRLPLLLMTLASFWSVTLAFYSFQGLIPNGNNVKHPCKTNIRWMGVGHENPLGGGSQNDFGRDFLAMGKKWTLELCMKDSDSDGKSNGEELGDPSCTWKVGDLPAVTEGITNPGVCEPVDSPNCREKSDFVNCKLDQFENCNRLKEPGVFSRTFRFTETPVPPKETNYFCKNFDLPVDQDYHMIAIEPILDNLEVAHHILILGCKNYGNPYFDTVNSCGMNLDDCPDILNGWTVGSSGDCYLDGIGVKVGLSGYKRVMLQIHWNNPYLREDYTDSSGLKVYFEPSKPDTSDLGVFLLGSQLLNIAPGQASVMETAGCPQSCSAMLLNKPIYVTGLLNHMHYMGASMKVEVFRGNKTIGVLAYDKVYSYDSPVKHTLDTPFEIRPGDNIVTSCEYNSLSVDKFVYYGDGTADEMCFAFVFVYPTDAFRSIRMCLQVGPLSTCDFFTRKQVDNCDWIEFINLNSDTMRPIRDSLERNCNMDGFCRPECYEVYKSLARHPCMSGEIFTFIARRLSQSYEGIKFLNRLLSCTGYIPPKPQVPDMTCTKADCGCE